MKRIDYDRVIHFAHKEGPNGEQLLDLRADGYLERADVERLRNECQQWLDETVITPPARVRVRRAWSACLDWLDQWAEPIIGRAIVWLGGIAIVLVLLAFFWMVKSAADSDTAKCVELLGDARTRRDTLDAKIACEAIRRGTTEAIAIGAAAGAIAGSRK